MRNILNTTGTALRFAGDMVNIAGVVAFAWAALHFKDMAVERFTQAGGTSVLDPKALSGTLSTVATSSDPAAAAISATMPYLDLSLAWVFAIAGGGCAWMALLGARWTYHFVLRSLNR